MLKEGQQSLAYEHRLKISFIFYLHSDVSSSKYWFTTVMDAAVINAKYNKG